MRPSPRWPVRWADHDGLARDKEPNYEKELPKAQAEFKAHKERLAKNSSTCFQEIEGIETMAGKETRSAARGGNLGRAA